MPSDRTAETALLTAAARGDQTAFDSLQQTYRPLIDSMAERFRALTGDAHAEDWRQEALIAFLDAVRSYCVEQTAVTFGLYAKIVIRNRLVSLLRKQSRAQKSSGILKQATQTPDPYEQMLQAERRSALLARFQSVLSPYEMQVFRLYLAGNKPRQIASSLGKTAKSVDNALSRLKTKIKSHAESTEFRQ